MKTSHTQVRGTFTVVAPRPEDQRYHELQRFITQQQFQPAALLEILHVAQRLFGHLSREALTFIARSLRLPPSKVFGVATFYHMFTLQPHGRHACIVCLGTACFMHGGGGLLETVEKLGAIKPGQTRQDQGLTLQVARCLGMCGIAPVVVYDGAAVGQQTPADLSARLKGWASA